ncbi:TonB-dependent receptor plug domain-containing protein [Wenzhouxiangella marina]|uniref:Uncharacterized protein n=1 Tax=Wenzhouxiangella marina TaxID=1579979 RepID=A0A0K0Y071_9GAMM|nr:TonB-dependent receptor [Wenzhouxiangella marina]AKS43315.1 hypothetical protein WM2015_2961 [Wenzhouxiangella marina]MBB6088570.1 hypothetical protein [Wenzhouxiangella marina]
MRHASSIVTGLLCLLCLGTVPAARAQHPFEIDAPLPECTGNACETSYEARFFDPYAPVTALDMVNNLPGFNLDNGNSGARGFGGAAGNILINGERVSAKSESPSELLSKIPAADVERIIVLRGQTGGSDLRGQSVIADVIRRDGGATGAWSLSAATPHPDLGLLPSGSVSYSDRLGGLRYTLGASASRRRSILDAAEPVLDASGAILEQRDEQYRETDDDFGLTANATYDGRSTRYGVNVQYEQKDEQGGETSLRQPLDQDAFLLLQRNDNQDESMEVGVDAERGFGDDFNAKLIALYRRDDKQRRSDIDRGEPEQPGERIITTATDQLETERILRLELDYSGFAEQLFEASIELAQNALDSDFELQRLGESGLEPVDVPGARTRVEEERLDFSIASSFSVGDVSVDAELAAEASEIQQTGGFSEKRSFFFWKPSLTVSYPPSESTVLRGRLLRQVSQLNFSDFVSAADLGDDELSLGNPNLGPARTWTMDLSVEHRFNRIGLISLTAFHDWIDDVQDVLPLRDGLEVPGNIGNGHRYGIRGEATFPLQALGITGGRLDVNGRWQASGVKDPLTRRTRELSGERGWTGRLEFRQDLPRNKLGWGMNIGLYGGYTRYGLDEIDRFESVWDFETYVESRAFDNLRIRLGVNDLFRETTDRDRQVFDGPRDSAPLAFRELRDRTRNRQFTLQVRGVF